MCNIQINSEIEGNENQFVEIGDQENRDAIVSEKGKPEAHIELAEAPRTCKQRCCHAVKESCTSPHVVVRELVTEFGWQFMIMLMCGYLLVKGSLYTFIATVRENAL